MAASKMKLKFFIDTNGQKVLLLLFFIFFAEVGKDFENFLFHILSLAVIYTDVNVDYMQGKMIMLYLSFIVFCFILIFYFAGCLLEQYRFYIYFSFWL